MQYVTNGFDGAAPAFGVASRNVRWGCHSEVCSVRMKSVHSQNQW